MILFSDPQDVRQHEALRQVSGGNIVLGAGDARPRLGLPRSLLLLRRLRGTPDQRRPLRYARRHGTVQAPLRDGGGAAPVPEPARPGLPAGSALPQPPRLPLARVPASPPSSHGTAATVPATEPGTTRHAIQRQLAPEDDVVLQRGLAGGGSDGRLDRGGERSGAQAKRPAQKEETQGSRGYDG